MSLQPIRPASIPAPIAPYEPAILAGGFVYVSGQLGLDPQTGDFVGADVAAQTRQALQNLRTILEAVNASLAHLAKVTVFLTSMDDYAAMNAVYAEVFGDGPKPAREAIAVAGLPKNGRVEISGIAYVG